MLWVLKNKGHVCTIQAYPCWRSCSATDHQGAFVYMWQHLKRDTGGSPVKDRTSSYERPVWESLFERTLLVMILSKFHTIPVKAFSQSALIVHVHVVQTLKVSILCVNTVASIQFLRERESFILSRTDYWISSLPLSLSLSLSILYIIYYFSVLSIFYTWKSYKK